MLQHLLWMNYWRPDSKANSGRFWHHLKVFTVLWLEKFFRGHVRQIQERIVFDNFGKNSLFYYCQICISSTLFITNHRKVSTYSAKRKTLSCYPGYTTDTHKTLAECKQILNFQVKKWFSASFRKLCSNCDRSAHTGNCHKIWPAVANSSFENRMRNHMGFEISWWNLKVQRITNDRHLTSVQKYVNHFLLYHFKLLRLPQQCQLYNHFYNFSNYK